MDFWIKEKYYPILNVTEEKINDINYLVITVENANRFDENAKIPLNITSQVETDFPEGAHEQKVKLISTFAPNVIRFDKFSNKWVMINVQQIGKYYLLLIFYE